MWLTRHAISAELSSSLKRVSSGHMSLNRVLQAGKHLYDVTGCSQAHDLENWCATSPPLCYTRPQHKSAQAGSAGPRARVIMDSAVHKYGACCAPQDSRVHSRDRLRDPNFAAILGHQHAISHVPSPPDGIGCCGAQLKLLRSCHTTKTVVMSPTLELSNCAPTGYKMYMYGLRQQQHARFCSEHALLAPLKVSCSVH